jgi:hypothetical protein
MWIRRDGRRCGSADTEEAQEVQFYRTAAHGSGLNAVLDDEREAAGLGAQSSLESA